MTAKAYSYIRFSSPEQAKGDSYRRQRAMALEYCEKHELELATSAEYTFFDKGLTAFHGKHLDDAGQLKRFFDCVDSGAIAPGSYLLVENLDRLSREKVDKALTSFLTLLSAGINVVTLSDGYVYRQGATAMELMMSIMHMGRAHSESDIKSVRLSAAWSSKKTLARTNKTPLGKACPYWLTLADGAYMPIKERVDTVRLIFELAIQGYGQGVIPRLLNERGIPVFGSRNRNHANAWGNSSVAKILNNRALLGEYQPTHTVGGVRVSDGEPVIGFFPLVIDESTFYQAQAARAQRRVIKTGNQSKRFNLLQGIVKCQLCGDAMHLVNKGKPPKGQTYLQCHSKRKGVCTNGYIRIERAELVLKEVLAKVDSLSLVQDSQGQVRKELTVIEGKMAEVAGRLETSSGLMNDAPSLALATQVQRLEDEQAALKADRQRLKEVLVTTEVNSKEDFFERLDLVTYEGRYAANSLLKRLEIKIKAQSVDRSQQGYAIYSGPLMLFGMMHGEGDPVILSIEQDMLDKQLRQGEINESEYTHGLDRNADLKVLFDDAVAKIMETPEFKALQASVKKA